MQGGASVQTYQVGARFEALIEIVLMAPLDSRYKQVGFNFISIQMWIALALTDKCDRHLRLFTILKTF